MALNETQKSIAERIADLLAVSPLDEEVKTALLENLDKLPETAVFELLDSLEKEQIALKDTAIELDAFQKQQDEDWVQTAQAQQQLADTLVDQAIADLEKTA